MPSARVSRTRVVGRFVAMTLVFGAVLFGTAGTIRWPGAWAYLALTTSIIIVYLRIVLRCHPDLLDERLTPPADAKAWDKPFVAIIGAIGPFAMLVAAGLDRRLGWSPPASSASIIAGLLLIASGGALVNYAVYTNRFFSGLIRIQRDRGHHVIDAGPYRVVRHPGYAGSIANMFGAALALGSHAGLAVAGVLTLVLIARTALEDRTLREELDGYDAYTRRVRFRLIPRVW